MTARICVPGSKSYTNRALVIGALTEGPVSIHNPLYSEDTEAMIGCLRALGLKIDTQPDEIIVHGKPQDIADTHTELFVHDSGTTARFLLALSCVIPGTQTIRGSERLNERPMRELAQTLRHLGADLTYELPITITSSSLAGNTVRMRGDVSSQFSSALLLIAPCLPKGLRLHLEGPLVSKPYIEMTLASMREGGILIDRQSERDYFVLPNQSYRQKQHWIEGDFSSAGYFFAIAALTRSTITVENLEPHSLQADRKFLSILEEMGNPVRYEKNSITIQGKRLVAVNIDMRDCPDQVMTMAVLAAFADGVSHISGVSSLRVKETERVFALKQELGKMGVRVEDTVDTLTIYGGKPHAAAIDTYGDHRMAMAFAVAGTHLPEMIIRNPEVVKKTFPQFWAVLESIR